MALTFSQSQGNGVTLSYSIVAEGGYFNDEDIVVELILISDGTVTTQTLGTDYTIADGNVIFVSAPSNLYYVRIRRSITNESTYSDFTRGNAFGADNLNDSFSQALYQVQQLADGFLPDDYYLKADLNAGNQRITNVADATNDSDAVNFAQMTEAIAMVGGSSGTWKIEDGFLYIYVA